MAEPFGCVLYDTKKKKKVTIKYFLTYGELKMTEREALKLSREALRTVHYAMIDAGVLNRQEVLNKVLTAIAAIEEALAQPEQEPRAWINWSALTGEPRLGWECESELASEPLYTNPPQRTWVGLTDEDEINWEDGGSLRDLVKAIEAKLKEKNT